NRIGQVGRGSRMTSKDYPWQTHKCTVEKSTVNRAIRAIIFTRPVGVEKTYYHTLCLILGGGIADLHLVYPLAHRIIIELFDLMLIHHAFNHELRPISIHFRR